MFMMSDSSITAVPAERDADFITIIIINNNTMTSCDQINSALTQQCMRSK